MTPLANKALTALWDRANRADLKGRPDATCSLRMTDSSFPDYLSIATAADRDHFHAEMREAQSAGAIDIDWDKLAGKYGQITRLRLTSLDALSRLLGRSTATTTLQQARAALASLSGQVPTVGRFLEAWAADKSPRGIRVADWQKVYDAARVIAACQEAGFADVSQRRVSAALFGDSKRIESLIPALNVLSAGEEGAPAESAEAVLANMGLLKHPSPILIAGPALVLIGREGESIKQVDVLTPYSGFAPTHIYTMRGVLKYLLSVENLTIFHEIANGNGGPLEGAVIYTGGFPSRAVLRAYRACLRGLFPDTPIYHWGDTDLGGFRIAALLADACAAEGRTLQLWSMAEGAHDKSHTQLSARDRESIVNICLKYGWTAAAKYISDGGLPIEQEIQTIVVP